MINKLRLQNDLRNQQKKPTPCMQGLYDGLGQPSSLLLMRGKKGREGGPVLCPIPSHNTTPLTDFELS